MEEYEGRAWRETTTNSTPQIVSSHVITHVTIRYAQQSLCFLLDAQELLEILVPRLLFGFCAGPATPARLFKRFGDQLVLPLLYSDQLRLQACQKEE